MYIHLLFPPTVLDQETEHLLFTHMISWDPLADVRYTWDTFAHELKNMAEKDIFQNWQNTCKGIHAQGTSMETYLGCKIPVHTGSADNEAWNDEGQAEQSEQTAAGGTLAAVHRAGLRVLAIKRHKTNTN